MSKSKSPRAAPTSSATLRNSKGRDYVLMAVAYAETVVEDVTGQHYGRYIRLAARRFLDNMRTAHRKQRPPYLFSAQRANHACSIIEKLPHVEGKWGTDNRIHLEPAQAFLLVQLFGFRNLDGSRRFTTVVFAVARKNAKSTIAAAILLYCFAYEAEIGPQVISAAMTGAQARIVFNIAARMVKESAGFASSRGLEAFKDSVVRYSSGGVFKPINSKASSQDGLNPSALCFDELHAHKTHDLYNVLRSAAGSRKNPLFLYTTTEGYENPGPWAQIRHWAIQVLERVVRAEHLLALYYTLDDEDEDFDESKWCKANPLLGVSVSMAQLRDYATEAKALPGSMGEFRIKRLNRPATAAGAWIDMRRWRRCKGPVPLDLLTGQPCYAGLDLASTRDMAAWRLVWIYGGEVYTWGRYWVPKGAVDSRSERGANYYAEWCAAGLITLTEGDSTDYAIIERDIREDLARFAPLEVAFDRWNANQLVTNLADAGANMVEFAQGAKSYNPAMKALEEYYFARKFHHGGDPVLTWNAANLVPRLDVNMNKAPDRKRSADKIDGMVALLMGLARAVLATQSQVSLPSDYQVVVA